METLLNEPKPMTAEEFGQINKLSTLIRVALADLRKVEQDDNYVVNMFAWHQQDLLTGKCAVCLAGAVMAKTLHLPMDLAVSGGNMFFVLYPSLVDRMHAIDDLREGRIRSAAGRLGLQTPHHDDLKLPDYEEDPKHFHDAMYLLADLLDQNGQ